MVSIAFYTTGVLAKYILIYTYERFPDIVKHCEFLYDTEIPFFDVYVNTQQRKRIKVLAPNDGVYTIPVQEGSITLRVDSTFSPDQSLVLTSETEVIKRVTLETDEINHARLVKYTDDAKEYVEKMLSRFQQDTQKHVTKYIYSEKWGWEHLSMRPKRNLNSIFIDSDKKKKLSDLVLDFINPDTRDEYLRFNIPYKLNFMLHGKQGTGKTSTVHAIASLIGADLYILNFPKWLDDSLLTRAFNTVSSCERERMGHASKNPCIILMEDIDCIFEDRKEHDTTRNSVTLSGLLNVLDGMVRPDGVIVFMTTNNLKCIDQAMLRPGRVDLLMEFKDPSKADIRAMFEYFLPLHVASFETFYEMIQYKGMTTSALQEFFFRNRTCKNICDHISQYLGQLAGRSEEDNASTDPNRMYM